MKYLLDELYTYEEDHSDALCPFDETASNSHAGEDRFVKPLTQEDGRHLEEKLEEDRRYLSEKLDSLTASIQPFLSLVQPGSLPESNTINPALLNAVARLERSQAPHRAAVAILLPSQSRSARSSPITYPSAHCDAAPHTVSGHVPSSSGGPIPLQIVSPNTSDSSNRKLVVPRISPSRREKHRTWEMVIKDWENPSPERSPVPLRDWDPAWLKNKNQAMQYHVRKMIAEEFILEFKRDATAFTGAYPAHVNGMTPLYQAILKYRQETGRAKVRANLRV
ncbi:hypothetical protein BKA70DRAFT_1521324 [Coprinopsis sp. MPI-PUGE-AT-0042]|nr:hypothetical protein BKA70DRAFT_1521324 [Coprinopsis sp. MPI-PUGE-AT-0042]